MFILYNGEFTCYIIQCRLFITICKIIIFLIRGGNHMTDTAMPLLLKVIDLLAKIYG